MKKLLRECAIFNYEKKLLKEETKAFNNDNSEIIVLTGIIQHADKLNQNGRIYPFNILRREIENYKHLCRKRAAYGAWDHTDSSIIEFQTVSHIISDVWMKHNGEVWGEIELLNTHWGKDAQALVKQNTAIGISSRAVGETKVDANGHDIVTDLNILSFDLVCTPSTTQAWLHLKEAKEISENEIKEMKNVFNNSNYFDKITNSILKW